MGVVVLLLLLLTVVTHDEGGEGGDVPRDAGLVGEADEGGGCGGGSEDLVGVGKLLLPLHEGLGR